MSLWGSAGAVGKGIVCKVVSVGRGARYAGRDVSPGLRYQMATHCQTAARSRSGECQNIGAEEGGGQLQTKNQIRVVTCKMYLFSLYFVKYMINALWKNRSHYNIQFCIEKL